MGRLVAIVLWLASRLYVVALLVGADRQVIADPRYYRLSLDRLASVGPAHTLTEYPVPALALLALPYLVVHALGHLDQYGVALATCALAVDGLFKLALLRAEDRHPDARRVLGLHPADWVWLLALPALGATAYARFDLVPGVLVGLAVLDAARRPRTAAVLGTLATGVKYWPAIVLPALLAARPTRWAMAAATATTGAILIALSVAWAGWHRVWTPLTTLQHRGLQIESVAATPAMVRYARSPGDYHVANGSSHAFEVTGPWVEMLLRLATLASVVLAVVLAVLWARAWRRPGHRDGDAEVLVWVVLTAISGFIVTGKVFSPQYLLWLFPAAAAGLVVLREESGRRRLLGWSVALLLVAAMTRQIFPLHYADLLRHDPATGRVVALLAVRNALVVALFLYALLQALRRLGPRSAPSRAPVPAESGVGPG